MKRWSGVSAASTGAPCTVPFFFEPMQCERRPVGDGLDQLERLGVVHGDRVLVHHVLGEHEAGAGGDDRLGRDLGAGDGLAELQVELVGGRARPGRRGLGAGGGRGPGRSGGAGRGRRAVRGRRRPRRCRLPGWRRRPRRRRRRRGPAGRAARPAGGAGIWLRGTGASCGSRVWSCWRSGLSSSWRPECSTGRPRSPGGESRLERETRRGAGRGSRLGRAAAWPAEPSAEGALQAAQRLLQRAARAAEVQAQEARGAEVGPGRERQAGVQAGAGGSSAVQPAPLQAAHVEPGQVRGLDVRHVHVRQLLGDRALDEVAVAAQVVEQLREPLAAVPVGGLGGGDREAAGERQQALVRAGEALAQVRDRRSPRRRSSGRAG